MRRDLMEILCCPVCKGDLELLVTEERGEEVLEGTLRCAACRVDYPINEGIPNLLPQNICED
ncbi:MULTISPECIES: methytransferase partner Trm112 [Methanoculleus]|jgi:uncharacterized protein YbaR (Trm112 family)|nr:MULTISPECIES: methytransferase partner Trm112 [Methanoculleus]NLN09026.1 Trm112 family protein [Methanoculleus thermophilus]HQD26955.1 methytransferase partner Trm112 [Methanoculleus thermophilus]